MRVIHLDALRGLAILLVVLYHTFYRWNDLFSANYFYDKIFFIKNGWLGVELFFMISGFVIFFSLDKTKNFILFIRNRYLRLLPAMIVAIIFIFSYSLVIGVFRPAGMPNFYSVLPSLTFIHESTLNFLLNLKILPLEGAFWSLYVEMKFYIYIAAAYMLLGKKNSVLLTFFISGLSAFIVFTCENFSILDLPYKLVNFTSAKFLPWFLVGMIVSYFYGRFTKKYFFLMFFSAVFFPFALFSSNLSSYLFSSLICIIFILSFHVEWIRSFLCNKFLLFFGFISYPLYLIHENFIISLSLFLHEFSFVSGGFIFRYLSFFTAVLFAWIIATFLEPKIAKYLKSCLTFRSYR